MAGYCQVTGATHGFGKTISHSHRRTSRMFRVNLQRKSYWVPSLGRRVTLTLSAKGIKTIDRRGIDAVASDLINRGERI
jgi:large subunit ribosomal protein L28